MPRFVNILCPIDFDQNSVTALRLASELALERNATLYLLHVVAVPPGPEVAFPFKEMETAARTRLERISRQKLKAGARYELFATLGDPALEILQLATRLGVDLIVMATHGRKGLSRLVLGSVAERVVRQAPCPVLTVKPKRARAGASRRRPVPKRMHKN